MKYRKFSAARTVGPLISLLLIVGTLLPGSARAGVFNDILASLLGKSPTKQTDAVSGFGNTQTMALLRPAMNIDPAPARGGGEVTIVNNSALMPEEGPSGTIADIEKPKVATISLYVVREGDTLSGVAKLFNVTPETILWANSDLSKGSVLKVGQTLTILPITSVRYVVKKGDTLASLAKRFNADAAEIGTYNGVDDSTLAVGAQVLIPNGEVPAAPAPSTRSRSKFGSEPAHNVGPAGTLQEIGYYLRPIAGGIRSQGVHGYNAVDLAAPIGTSILASAGGDVIVAKEGGWNGGYGSYVVIQHGNGSQTLYSHASKVIAYVGEHVVQGQVIGYVGQTGKATGPHVHFEIRNGIKNPF